MIHGAFSAHFFKKSCFRGYVVHRAVYKHVHNGVDMKEVRGGFVWHANDRHSDSARFYALLGAVLRGAK